MPGHQRVFISAVVLVLFGGALAAMADSTTTVQWRGVGAFVTVSCADTASLAPWLQLQRERSGYRDVPILPSWIPAAPQRALGQGEAISLAAPPRPWWQALAVTAAAWSGGGETRWTLAGGRLAETTRWDRRPGWLKPLVTEPRTPLPDGLLLDVRLGCDGAELLRWWRQQLRPRLPAGQQGAIAERLLAHLPVSPATLRRIVAAIDGEVRLVLKDGPWAVVPGLSLPIGERLDAALADLQDRSWLWLGSDWSWRRGGERWWLLPAAAAIPLREDVPILSQRLSGSVVAASGLGTAMADILATAAVHAGDPDWEDRWHRVLPLLLPDEGWRASLVATGNGCRWTSESGGPLFWLLVADALKRAGNTSEHDLLEK